MLEPERVIYRLDNLFNGDERISNQIHKMLNDNWYEVFRNIREGYENGFGLIFKDITKRVFTRVAIDDIFLP